MSNATGTSPVRKQAVLMVVIGDLRTTDNGRQVVSGLFRNADKTVQNFSAFDAKAVAISKFRKGSNLLVTGFSIRTARFIGSGTQEVIDMVVTGFQIDKVGQAANQAEYAKMQATAVA